MKKSFFTRLNWTGFWFMLPLTIAGVSANKSVDSLFHGLFLVLVFWVVFGGMFLILGRSDK